jgi:hypothetical protein
VCYSLKSFTVILTFSVNVTINFTCTSITHYNSFTRSAICEINSKLSFEEDVFCLVWHPGILGLPLFYLLSDIKGRIVSVSEIMVYQTSPSDVFMV